MWDAFIEKWESGGVPDFRPVCEQLAADIDQQLQLG